MSCVIHSFIHSCVEKFKQNNINPALCRGKLCKRDVEKAREKESGRATYTLGLHSFSAKRRGSAGFPEEFRNTGKSSGPWKMISLSMVVGLWQQRENGITSHNVNGIPSIAEASQVRNHCVLKSSIAPFEYECFVRSHMPMSREREKTPTVTS